MNINKSEFVDDVKAESLGRKSSTIVNKTKLRNEIEEQMAKFLANGGTIHPAEKAWLDWSNATGALTLKQAKGGL